MQQLDYSIVNGVLYVVRVEMLLARDEVSLVSSAREAEKRRLSA
jgi:hypothetical protein